MHCIKTDKVDESYFADDIRSYFCCWQEFSVYNFGLITILPICSTLQIQKTSLVAAPNRETNVNRVHKFFSPNFEMALQFVLVENPKSWELMNSVNNDAALSQRVIADDKLRLEGNVAPIIATAAFFGHKPNQMQTFFILISHRSYVSERILIKTHATFV